MGEGPPLAGGGALSTGEPTGLDVTPTAWAAVDQLLDQVLDLPEGERRAWLEALPPEAQAHRPRLEALLAHADSSPVDSLPRLVLPMADPTGKVGPYRLLRRLGEGGMGTVWLAQRVDVMTHRPVALKLPRVAWHDAALVRRLAREREILAALDHPHIARLLDAGVTAGGHPYLALEYVEGRPIDVHVREEGLGVRARLELFQQVLAAVAHAHARLVVHRDLKPSNILVTRDGQVRLLDFGVAKLLEAEEAGEGDLTLQAGAPFTPNYASPEQLAGEPIGVATDVYSLGVVLYELLAGAPPYRLQAAPGGTLRQALAAVKVAPPSAAAAGAPERRALAGDLDTLVLKALAPAAEDRYPTVSALAEDLSRFLDGYPLKARPDRWSYRARKLVARHRGAVLAASAALAAVLFGASAAVWQARRATAERRHAEEVKEYLLGVFREASPYGAQGHSPTALELLRQARGGLDGMGEHPEVKVELLTLLGSTLLDLGDADAAQPLAAEALSLSEAQLAEGHLLRLRARLLHAEVSLAKGRGPAIAAELEKLVPELEQRAAEHPAELVRVLQIRANQRMELLRREQAIGDARRAFELAAARLGERDPRTVEAAVLLAETNLGGREPLASLAEAEKGLRFAQAAYQDRPRHPHVITARDVHGRALCAAGQADQGLQEAGQALADAIEVLGATSPVVGTLSVNRGFCERRVGLLEEALQDADRGVALRGATRDRNSRAWGNTRVHRAATLLAMRRPGPALEDLGPAAEALKTALGEGHRLALNARAMRALALAYAGRAEEALAEAALLEPSRGGLSESVLFDSLVGTALRLAGRPGEGLERQRRALERLPEGPLQPGYRMRVLFEQGLAEVELGLDRDAERSLRAALELSASEHRRDTPMRAEGWAALGRALARQRRLSEAVAFLERAEAFWRGFDPANPEAARVARWLLEVRRGSPPSPASLGAPR